MWNGSSTRTVIPFREHGPTEAPENPAVRAGYVDLYFRTSKRLFVLKFPGHEDRIFNLHLLANPLKAKYQA